ncbi:hypothetical protein E2C01_002726 [Portunus trituberculatus]|uniref:Uncharacterized protein n=1 Tax=Portunus trituberculatus TaxID=210409 RepID=A0A5B7CM00_PORTR|nr:hypothetical protein [Portunus trituberculatus]
MPGRPPNHYIPQSDTARLKHRLETGRFQQRVVLFRGAHHPWLPGWERTFTFHHANTHQMNTGVADTVCHSLHQLIVTV